MMRTRLAMWATAAALLAPALLTTTPVTAADLPQSIANSPDADKEPNRSVIEAYVAQQVERLRSEDPTARAAGREGLISKVTQTAHPVFVDFYCNDLATRIKPVLADTKLESRLNGAIVLARLAPSDRSARLSDAIILALGDKQQPVTLWAMKAAAQLLPAALTVQSNNNPLLAKVSEVALATADTVLITESYDALTLTSNSTDVIVLRDRFKEPDWKRLVVLVAPEFSKLWAKRLEMYASGKVVEPMAEQIPPRFVSPLRSWTAASKEQQVAWMQMLSDQLSLASELATAASTDKAPFLRVVQVTANALQVVSQAENNKPLGDAAALAGKVSDNSAAAAIQGAVSPVLKAIQAIPKFAAVKPAPKVKS